MSYRRVACGGEEFDLSRIRFIRLFFQCTATDFPGDLRISLLKILGIALSLLFFGFIFRRRFSPPRNEIAYNGPLFPEIPQLRRYIVASDPSAWATHADHQMLCTCSACKYQIFDAGPVNRSAISAAETGVDFDFRPKVSFVDSLHSKRDEHGVRFVRLSRKFIGRNSFSVFGLQHPTGARTARGRPRKSRWPHLHLTSLPPNYLVRESSLRMSTRTPIRPPTRRCKTLLRFWRRRRIS